MAVVGLRHLHRRHHRSWQIHIWWCGWAPMAQMVRHICLCLCRLWQASFAVCPMALHLRSRLWTVDHRSLDTTDEYHCRCRFAYGHRRWWLVVWAAQASPVDSNVWHFHDCSGRCLVQWMMVTVMRMIAVAMLVRLSHWVRPMWSLIIWNSKNSK